MKRLGLVWIGLWLLAACAPSHQIPVAVPVPPSNLGGQGTDIGGAIDDVPAHVGSAWFVGKQLRIRYCIRSAKASDLPRLRSSIEGAFRRWSEYVEFKQVYEGVHSDHQPTFELDFKNSCDGTEDLRFLFAVTDPEVEKYRGRFERPLAFAQRTAFDRMAGWSRGFIWVDGTAPWDRSAQLDWNHNTLDLLLLHEVGHVLGNPHVHGTVMDPDFSSNLTSDQKKNESLAQIDQGRELAPHRNTRFTAVAWEMNRWAFGHAFLSGAVAISAFKVPEYYVERGGDGQWLSIGFTESIWGIRRGSALSWEGIFETKTRVISRVPVFKTVLGETVWFRESLCRTFTSWIRNYDDLLQITIQEGMGGIGAESPVLLQLDQPRGNISLQLWLSSRLRPD